MRIIHSLIFILTAYFLLAVPSPAVAASSAMSCESSGGNSFSFGSLSIGSSASTTASVNYTCHLQDYTPGVDHYASICLSSEDAPPFQMKTNGSSDGKQYTLLFRAYNLNDSSQELLQNDNLIQQTFVINTQNTTVSGSFNLRGVIPAGQSDVPAYQYFNYSMTMRIRWNTANSMAALPSCQSGAAQGSATNGGNLQSSASVSDGCAIQSVSNMDFGVLDASTLRQQNTKASAVIQARCPTGTAFSLGIDNGNHSNGSSRQLCNSNNNCLAYSLWQDSSTTLPWGNTPNVDRLAVSAATGSVTSFPVYGLVPSGQPVNGDGVFSDDVVITLTY